MEQISKPLKSSQWTPEEDALLRELWATPLSCTEIGKRLYKTKSAITGRAHRMELPTRGSPIKNAPPRDFKRETAQREAVLALYEVGVIDPTEIAARTGITRSRVMNIYSRNGIKIGRVRQRITKAEDPAPKAAQPMQMPVYDVDPKTLVLDVGGSKRHCQFIPGDPAGPRTLYCGKPVELGQTYCGHHHAICWRPHILQQKKPEAA